MDEVKYDNVTIYRSGKSPASEAMVYAHGGYEQKDNSTKVPSGLNVYFYTPHGTSSVDGTVSAVVRNVPAEPSKTVNFPELGKTFLNWGTGSVTSIAGPGATIYNYMLSWNAKSARFVNEMKQALKNQPNYPKDLIIVDAGQKGVDVTLAELFIVMAKDGAKYSILHYLPCRTEIGAQNERDPTAVDAKQALHKLVS